MKLSKDPVRIQNREAGHQDNTGTQGTASSLIAMAATREDGTARARGTAIIASGVRMELTSANPTSSPRTGGLGLYSWL